MVNVGPEPAHAADSGPLLSLDGISKAYGGTQALDDVSLDLHAGEVHGLVGENGAGKSTLMKVLAGAVAPDAGRIVLGGIVRDRLTPREAMELGVGIVYQDADLVSSLTVAENVFLGMEPFGRLRTIDAAQQRHVTAGFIAELGVDLEPDRLAEKLSPAQRHTLEIAFFEGLSYPEIAERGDSSIVGSSCRVQFSHWSPRAFS